MATFDGDYTSAIFNGTAEPSYPDPGELPGHYVIKQRAAILPIHYTGPPMDTAHPNYPSAYCVGDSNYRRNGPLLEFDRTFSTVPALQNYDDSQSVAYPGMGKQAASAAYVLDESGGVARQKYGDFIPRENSLTLRVPVRREVFFVLPGVEGSFGNVSEIPICPAFRVVNATGQEVDDLASAGATPDLDKYKSWIANRIEIVVAATQITRYLGNIWRVETTYARAR